MFNPRRAAIHVIKLEPGYDAPVYCVQCGGCIAACNRGALSMKAGVVRVDPEKCDGCGLCVPACPYGAMHVDPETRKAVKCDICGECVKYCPQGALRLVDAKEAMYWKQRTKARSLVGTTPPLFRKLWYRR